MPGAWRVHIACWSKGIRARIEDLCAGHRRARIAAIKASAVEPDVRVETQDTLSLGEDRTVLAANATVDITRAGILAALAFAAQALRADVVYPLSERVA